MVLLLLPFRFSYLNKLVILPIPQYVVWYFRMVVVCSNNIDCRIVTTRIWLKNIVFYDMVSIIVSYSISCLKRVFITYTYLSNNLYPRITISTLRFISYKRHILAQSKRAWVMLDRQEVVTYKSEMRNKRDWHIIEPEIY